MVLRKKLFLLTPQGLINEIEFKQNKFGIPINIECSGFVKILASGKKQANKKGIESYICFNKIELKDSFATAIKHSDLKDLFLFGKHKEDKAQTDIINVTQNYIIRRDIIDCIIDKLNAGNHFISIHARLGCGKTILAKLLAYVLTAKGETVFMITGNYINIDKESKQIINEYDNPIFIIDDFFKYPDYHKIITQTKCKFIITARNKVFLDRENYIHELFLKHSPLTIELPKLNDSEIQAFILLINQAGLWQKDAVLSTEKKIRKIKNRRHNSNFADTLIGFMESNDIIGRFEIEMKLLKEYSPECYEHTNNNPDTTMLMDSFGNNLEKFLKKNETTEFLRVFLLKNSYGVYYKRLIINLMRFNYLKYLCHNKNYKRIYDFYDELAANPTINKDDLFWNAFGMCERMRKKYASAKEKFHTSISLTSSHGKNYIPYQTKKSINCLYS